MKTFRHTITLFGLFLTVMLPAQRPIVIKPSIHTLQTIAENHWKDLPIINLNSSEKINIDFDDFTHEAMRYVYRIEHYSADWTPTSSLFESDYIDGFSDGNLIDDSEQSINSNTLYTHYHFSIPNEKCKLKLSGNYCVTIYDENNNDEPILKTYFMVAENVTTINMTLTSNTDIDIYGRHQQIEADVHFKSIRINDWRREIKTYFLQNNRWDNVVSNPSPQYVKADEMIWTHNKQLIFDGGNEYHKFEILDVNHANMGVESTEWDGTKYHTFLWPNTPRLNYVYDEDANGAYFIRNSDNRDNNCCSEYQNVHFFLKSDKIKGNVYINGNWTYDSLIPIYQMNWNEDAACYEAEIALKQGYYNYQYLCKTPTGDIKFIASEGNFYQTENKYTTLVYYRAPGGRYDRLIGVAYVHTRNDK